jgi:hypothetical protein
MFGLGFEMISLAMVLIDYVNLPADFQEIARAYEPEKNEPGPFWVVVHNGNYLGIYLDPKEALAHLLGVKAALESGKTPRRQRLGDVATLTRKLAQVREKNNRHQQDDDPSP